MARYVYAISNGREWIVEKEEKVIIELKGQGKETGAFRRKEDGHNEVRNETEGRQR